ncbi:hypothetical protein D9758_015761 [Tetrapyrgos nigripes]|uniref:CxC5 like cysteine cluster associated with KDZ domain-containing protein n=1 Tax=Tetrapyrgos nigripes TaxID=182062 RepID=A0A8H5CAL3_9AGAR|nr:hypothetical protein D9758_015761 [Tetrapyrgos nigripes]
MPQGHVISASPSTPSLVVVGQHCQRFTMATIGHFSSSSLTSHLNITTILDFIRFTTLAKSTISLEQRAFYNPPEKLPTHIARLLVSLLAISEDVVGSLWENLKEVVWNSSDEVNEQVIRRYNHFALQNGTSYRHLYPPSPFCQVPSCPHAASKTPLREPSTYRATLFTLRDGTLPIYTTSLYCRGSNTSNIIFFAVLMQSAQVVIHAITSITTYTSEVRQGHITLVYLRLYRFQETSFTAGGH